MLDNESIYIIQENRNLLSENKGDVGKVAIFIDKDPEELTAESGEQLQKIIASTKQIPENTLVINAVKNAASLMQLYKSGVHYVVIFASVPLPLFSSINIQKGRTFTISGLEVFPVSGLDTFRTNDAEKKALWAFIKPKI